MILSEQDIWTEINKGSLSFRPDILRKQVSTSSIDLRLGNQFTIFKPPVKGARVTIDLAEMENPEQVLNLYGEKRTLLDNESVTLLPNEFVLGYTLEYLELPNYLAARIEGRSSLARLGISVHQTAPVVHATFKGQLRLEISNHGPFSCILRPGLSICQLVIERLDTPAETTLKSEFQGQTQ